MVGAHANGCGQRVERWRRVAFVDERTCLLDSLRVLDLHDRRGLTRLAALAGPEAGSLGRVRRIEEAHVLAQRLA